MVVKAQKRRVNLLKQERAIHPHIYLEHFEYEDIWNHVHTSHTISESCFKREGLLEKVKAAILSDVGTVSSSIILSGGLKAGKSWLCSQIPSLLGEEALTLVRYCGLTSLTTTLPKLLAGLTKQLSSVYQTPLLSATTEQLDAAGVFALFRVVLEKVSESTDKPVVLVLDSFDKLAASGVYLSHFSALCRNAIPANVVLVLSVTTKTEDSEFADFSSCITKDNLFQDIEKGLRKFYLFL